MADEPHYGRSPPNCARQAPERRALARPEPVERLCHSSDVKCWINCVSKNHVLAGVAGGFTQAAHGKAEPLRHLSSGDVMVFYSEGTQFRAGERLQAFTAIGRVAGKEPFQTKVTAKFIPWRRRVEFVESEEASILPLIPDLTFITDKTNWGLSLRRGLFEISEADCAAIARAMKADLGLS